MRRREDTAILALLLYSLLLLTDGTGLLRLGLAASALHEGGHALAWLWLTGTLPHLQLEVGGIALDIRGRTLTAGQRILLAAAGPLTNLLLSAGVLLWMEYKAGYGGYWFAAANLLVGVFNLLPFGSLDGRNILDAFRG